MSMPSKSTSNINPREPFAILYNQGLIMGPDGQKMSKSRGNVINPDDVVREYGADCLRMYEMFMGPFEDSKPWSTSSIKGVFRFLDRIWKIIETVSSDSSKTGSNPSLTKVVNSLIKNIDEKIPNLQFNTCVSDFMKFMNDYSEDLYQEDLKVFLKLLFPFAPVISAEGLERLGEADFLEKYSNYQNVWPIFDPNQLVADNFKIKVMINNKFRGELEAEVDLSEEAVLEKVRNIDSLAKFLPEKITKTVYVPGKLLNII